MNEILLKYKKYIVIGFAIFIILICIFMLNGKNINKTINSNKDISKEIKVLNVTYKNGKDIVIDNFRHSFQAEKEIVIENKSKNYIFYDLEWKDVSNTLKNQSNFTYEIESLGHNAGSVGKSQVPVADSKILSSLMISPGKEHTYTIIFNYKSGVFGENAKFKGFINVYKVHED